MNSKEIKEIKSLMLKNKEWKNINSIDILGYDRVMEIYNDQKEYFDTKCKVARNVYTDSEGLTYNSLIEEE